MDPFAAAGEAGPDDTALARRLHAAGAVPVDTLVALLRDARTGRAGGVTLADLLVARGVLPAAELAPLLAPPHRQETLALTPARRAEDATAAQDAAEEDLDAAGASPEDTALARRLHAAGRVPLDALRRLLREARAARAGGGASLADRLVDGGLLSAPDLGPFLEAGAPERAVSSRRLPAERVIGDYRVLESLGAGGMGQVYLVEHVTTGARYALKALPATTRDDLKERFRRESQAMAAVDRHPGVVRVHASGEDQDVLFYVMDHVTGGDLSARLARGRLPPLEAAALVRDLAQAVAHVHARGVLHRDLKPSNVLFDERGTPKLVDFGLAWLAGAEELTRSGMTLGTPSYMPPEQVEGRREEIDARSDVYGLGAILYHCLAGRAPFLGATPMNTLSMVLKDPPVPPRELWPDIPPALEAACLRALAKSPTERFTTADDLAQALARVLGAGPGPRTRRLARARRRRTRVTLALAALLAVALTAGWLVASAPARAVRAHVGAGRMLEAWAAAHALPPGAARDELRAAVADAVAAQAVELLRAGRPEEAAQVLLAVAADPAHGPLDARLLALGAEAALAAGRAEDARRLAGRLPRGAARGLALRACVVAEAATLQDLVAARRFDLARARLALYEPVALGAVPAAVARAAVEAHLAAPPDLAAAAAWARACQDAAERARLAARCALAARDAAQALRCLAPALRGAPPERDTLDLALEALLELDDAAAAAEWVAWAGALPRDTPGADALQAAAALAGGDWPGAIVAADRPGVDPALATRLRFRAHLGLGLGPRPHLPAPPAGGRDPFLRERDGVALLRLWERLTVAPALAAAEEDLLRQLEAAPPRLGTAGAAAARRAQSALLVHRARLARTARAGEAAARAPLGLVLRLRALAPASPEATGLGVVAAWLAWEGPRRLPADAELAALRARAEHLASELPAALSLLELLAAGARGRPDTVLALAERLAREVVTGEEGQALNRLRVDAALAELAAVAAVAGRTREAAAREGLLARARGSAAEARRLEPRSSLLAVWEAHAALACGDTWDARRILLERVPVPEDRDVTWHLVLAEVCLGERDGAGALAALGELADARPDVQARAACVRAAALHLSGDVAGRDRALAEAERAEAAVNRAADQDLLARALPWRTVAETRRALGR